VEEPLCGGVREVVWMRFQKKNWSACATLWRRCEKGGLIKQAIGLAFAFVFWSNTRAPRSSAALGQVILSCNW
jgi:hypothetical protein